MPKELLTSDALSYIASAVGIPLYLDKATEECRRIGAARVCVEVNCSGKPPNSVEVEI